MFEKEDLVQALYSALARKSERGDGENDGGDYRKRKATDDEDGEYKRAANRPPEFGHLHESIYLDSDSEDDKFSGARGGCIRTPEAPPFSPLDGRHQDGGLTCKPARSRNTGRRE